MGKLRLDINSTYVEHSNKGHYGIVDIIFNGTTLASAKQLSATVESLEYDVGIDNTSNTLKIALLNDVGHDTNNNGNYTDEGDEVLKAIVSSLSYSTDSIDYITLIPQVATNYNVPSGPYAGNIYVLTESRSVFTSWLPSCELIFNSYGMVSNSYWVEGVKGKVLENGNYLDLTNGKTYDINGNEVTEV